MDKKNIASLITLLLAMMIQLSHAQKVVVSSASIFQDMAARIGGDKIISKTIVPIGSDPHVYEPTPSDVGLIQGADLLLVNGLTFEHWIDDLIANSGTDAPISLITEGIPPIASEQYANSYDPHAWMDVSHGVVYIDNIKEALIAIDPENKSYYLSNYTTYKSELENLDQYILDAVQTIPENQRILITSHDAFAYYGKRYGLTLNAIMGISTEAEARSSDVIRVSKAIRDSGVPAIFVESTINPKMINQVAADNDVVVGGELFADSISDEDGPAASYAKMLRHNTDTIVEALRRSKKSPIEKDSGSKSSFYLAILGVALIGLLLVLLFLRRQ